MRSIVQSLFARHPAAVAGLAGLRWAAWLIAGHPFGLTLGIVAWVVELPLWYGALTLVGAEAALALWAFAGYTDGARALSLWVDLCRFRRRWPAGFSRAYDDHRFFPVIAPNYYSVPGGLRSVLVAPQLSLIPLAFSYRTVGWILTPRTEHDLAALRAAADRVAAADTRVAQIEIREVRGHRLALIVSFERSDGGSGDRHGPLGAHVGDGDHLDVGVRPIDHGGLDGRGRTRDHSWLGRGEQYDGVIPGLQRIRLGELPDRSARDTAPD